MLNKMTQAINVVRIRDKSKYNYADFKTISWVFLPDTTTIAFCRKRRATTAARRGSIDAISMISDHRLSEPVASMN